MAHKVVVSREQVGLGGHTEKQRNLFQLVVESLNQPAVGLL